MFEIYNHKYDFVKGGFGDVEAAEEWAQEWSLDHPNRTCSVQLEVEVSGYPDRKIVSTWCNGERIYKTHKYDEVTAA